MGLRVVLVTTHMDPCARGFSQGRPSETITPITDLTQGIFKYPEHFIIATTVPLDLGEGALWMEHWEAGQRVGMHPVLSIVPYAFGMSKLRCDMTNTAQPYTPSDAPW
jgi:hypothetical protein